MKKLIAAVALLAMTATLFCSCGETGTESGNSSAGDSNSSESTTSYEKPAAITKDNTDATVFNGETGVIDVTPENMSELMSSFASEVFWLSDTQLLVVYSHSVEPMPNYFVTKALVRVYDTAAANTFTEFAVPDDFANVKGFKGGFAVYTEKKLTVYNTDFSVRYALDIDANPALFDISEDGNTAVFANKSKDALSCSDGTSVTKKDENGAIAGVSVSSDGKYAAYFKNGEPFTVDIASGTISPVATGEVKFSSTVTSVWSNGDVLFIDNPSATPRKALSSVKYSVASEAVSYPSIGGEFENPYAHGTIIDDYDSIRLVIGLARGSFEIGNLEIQNVGTEFTTSEALKLDGGYCDYNSYAYSESGKLAINEVINMDGDIKCYVHTF